MKMVAVCGVHFSEICFQGIDFLNSKLFYVLLADEHPLKSTAVALPHVLIASCWGTKS